MKKLLPAIYALSFSAALIVFSVWFLLFFDAGRLYRTATGIPAVHELKSFDMLTDTGVTDIGYKIKLSGIDTTFVLRMYGESFSLAELDKHLSAKEQTEIIYHPLPNEHKEFEIYSIRQGQKSLYTFNKRFTAQSSGAFGWTTLVAGILLFLLGLWSLKNRMKSV